MTTSRTSPGGVAPRAIPKVATGVRGLDEILEGGLPEGRVTVVNGGPGSGKTVLGLEFACHGARAGQPALLVSFEERAEVLRRNALSLGLDLAALEQAGTLFVMDSRPDLNAVRAGEYTLEGLLAILSGKARDMGARRLVIDALDVVLRLFEKPEREREELQRLIGWMGEQEMTCLLTARVHAEVPSKSWPAESETSGRRYFLEFATDCLIHLDQRVVGQVSTRRLRVVKYRGSGYGPNEHPCVITDRGIELLPVSAVRLEQGLGPPVSSGHPVLDGILGGGFRRGSSVLISGASGTGKTTLLCTFARGACQRGEKTLLVSFEESRATLLAGMQSAGIDLQPWLDDRSLHLACLMPESMGAESHLVYLLRIMDRIEPAHLLVDAISACRRVGSPQASYELLMRLSSEARRRGITVLFSNQLGHDGGTDGMSGVGVSSLLDALLTLRLADDGTGLRRVLTVVKSRGMAHSSQHHRFRITGSGIQVPEPGAGGTGPEVELEQTREVDVPPRGKGDAEP